MPKHTTLSTCRSKLRAGPSCPETPIRRGDPELDFAVQVYISDKWKFIYVRQPKSSSTAVLHAIKKQLCGLADGNGDCRTEDFRQISDLEEHKWRSYFVFTFVRNPWLRVLSAHKMFSLIFLRRCGIATARAQSRQALNFACYRRMVKIC
jgi:Sulfotransferase family